MTETEHILLAKIVENYWLEFSALVEKYLAQAPAHLQDELSYMLQDHSSVFGRK